MILQKALPDDAAERKGYPLYRGLFKYFPDALLAVARISFLGNQQHHPDQPLHWDKSKSTDEEDALLRHMMEGDWEKVAWRALAKLQRHIEEQSEPEPLAAPATDFRGSVHYATEDDWREPIEL